MIDCVVEVENIRFPLPSPPQSLSFYGLSPFMMLCLKKILFNQCPERTLVISADQAPLISPGGLEATVGPIISSLISATPMSAWSSATFTLQSISPLS